MRFLEYPSIWEWCRGHGFSLEKSAETVPRLMDDPTLVHRSRVVFAPHGPLAYEAAVASRILAVLGFWDECLLWVMEWGVWPSSEDWPRYYAFRGRHGERMSLEAAPGHLVTPGDEAEFLDLLVQVLENGWDAVLLPSSAGQATGRRIRVSHDGWAQVDAREPLIWSVPGLESGPA